MTSKAPRFDPYTWALQDIYNMEEPTRLGKMAHCGRLWLIVFNTIFTILGLVFFVVGCVMRFQSNVFSTYLSGLIATVQAGETNLSLTAYLDAIAFTLIVIGIFIFVIGAVGFLGSCCKLRTCLAMYAVIVLLVLILQIAGVALLFTLKPQMDSHLRTLLKKTLSTGYGGDTGTDAISIGWNFAFVQLDCCGVDNYTDVQSAVMWNRSVGYNEFAATLETPFTCCKLEGDFPNFQWPDDPYCAIEPKPETSNYKQGCYDAMENLLLNSSPGLISIVVILAFIEIANAVAALLIYRDLKPREEDTKE